LIQGQEQTRNLDSKIRLPGFFRFNFQFHSSFADTFSTASVMSAGRDPAVAAAHVRSTSNNDQIGYVQQSAA
jgi:hypothetical protein